MIVRFVWIPVETAARLPAGEADTLTGQDLWLCLEDKDGFRQVLAGYHLQGMNEGFYVDGGRVGPARGVTHYMIRDGMPPLPEEF